MKFKKNKKGVLRFKYPTYVFAAAWIVIKMFTTIKMGRITDQKPVSSELN
jgi:hypothetical protein